MDQDQREVKKLYKSIVYHLDMYLENDMNQLFNEKIYCQMFKILFPFLDNCIDDIAKESSPTGEKLQGLIELLSYPVLSMNLSHINGHDIANGDLRHLQNFLQILLEISKLYRQQNERPNSNPTSANNSEVPIAISNHSAPVHGQPEYNDESEYGCNSSSKKQSSASSKKETKQIKRNKSQTDLVENNKKNQLLALGENILPAPLKQLRIITTDPNMVTKKAQKKQWQEELEQLNEQEQQMLKEIEEMSEIDVDFLQSIDPENVPEEQQEKYQRELQKYQLAMMAQQQDSIIDQQIDIVKGALKKMRGSEPLDEKQTIDKIVQKRNQYKEYLKDNLKGETLKKQQQRPKTATTKRPSQTIKMRKDQDDLKKEIENQQLSIYYKMRDEKMNYLRKIHRIIFELEKRKIIDEKKEHLQTRRQQNIITRNALISIENAYNDKFKMLKEKLQNDRKERQTSGKAQRELLSKLERELKQEKIKKIDQIRSVWQQEKEKFDNLIHDDGELEKKILQIYKKY